VSESQGLIAPAERDQAIARLSEAFATDVLALEEFERRVAAVYAATTRTQIAALIADLPAPGAPGATVVPIAPMPRRVRAIFGNVERGGFVDVPQRLRIDATFGNVELDLTGARFGAVTEIAIHATFGSVEIRLPAGVQVENEGIGILGSFQCAVGTAFSRAGAGRPLVRITGRALFGSVEISDATTESVHIRLQR
jgi:hypothetical protein